MSPFLVGVLRYRMYTVVISKYSGGGGGGGGGAWEEGSGRGDGGGLGGAFGFCRRGGGLMRVVYSVSVHSLQSSQPAQCCCSSTFRGSLENPRLLFCFVCR